MVRFIYGASANAKSKYLIENIGRDAEAGVPSFLIVPEQFAVQSERSVLAALPPYAQLTVEVLNFSRLYNKLCREYGGLEYNYITKPTRHLLMWENLRQLSGLLEVYGDSVGKDPSFCDMMLSQIGELKSCCITPLDIENAASRLDKELTVTKKLKDIALIYAAFENLVSQSFSDSADDVSKLCDILSEHNFFRGAKVYIDSFTSFTAAEHRVIERIFAQADSVSITIPLDAPDSQPIYAASILDSRERLIKNAKKHSDVIDVVVDGEEDRLGECINYLSRNLWTSVDSAPAPEGDDTVNLIKCSSPYTEAEGAAAVVLRLMREGYRCRDIAVVMRDAERYRGIIEPAFEKCAIPFYFSEKTDLSTTPIVKFLTSALRIKMYNWQTTDVISHLKTGLYDLDVRDIDLFEQYITTWQIKGSAFTSSDFAMNPDGYAEELSERGKKILAAANSVRRYLCDALCPLFEVLESDIEFEKKIAALYEFLVFAKADERLKNLAQREAARGNMRVAKEYSRLFAFCCDALGEIAEALSSDADSGDMHTEEIFELLTLFFSKTDMGSIPTSADEVVIGSASMLRASRTRCVLMLGLCEGVFPASVSENGLLTLSERSMLEDMGFEFSERSTFAQSDELMYVQRAVQMPTEKLFMFTSLTSSDGSKTSASLPFLRASAFFGSRVFSYDPRDLLTLTPSARGALPYLDSLGSDELDGALRKALLEHSDTASLVGGENDRPVSDTSCTVSSDTAQKVFGKDLYLSQSRIDKFVNCNFSYYCNYVLKLREEQISRFKANDIGTFIHYVLENLLKRIVGKDGVDTSFSEDDIAAMTRETVDEYIKKINAGNAKISGRLAHLYRKLYNLSTVLIRNIIEEFRHSSFRPEFFELKTDGKEGNPSPMEIELEGGRKIVFSGIIDRVDIFKSEEKVYIRVVDYKTGTKQFSLEDVKYGLNIQMLLYLFTLTKNKNADFKKKIGGGESIPAGVVYLSSNIPQIELEDHSDASEVLKMAEGELQRSGLIVDDLDVLEAMNDDMSSDFLLGVKKKADGTVYGKALASAEVFSTLQNDIEKTLKQIAEKMMSGAADAEPLIHGQKDPCEYCAMKPICRRQTN